MVIASGRRIVRVAMSSQLISDMMRVGWNVKNVSCVKGIPEDAIFAGASLDNSNLEVYMFFTHPSFDIVQEGCVVPIVQVVHRFGSSQ